MTTIGLDLSINSTGICVNKNGRYRYYIISSHMTKKMKEFDNKYVTILEYNKKTADKSMTYSAKESIKTNNIYYIVKYIREIVRKHKPDIALIEGVSYGSTGSSALIDLTGLNFMVRMMLEEMNIPFVIVSPSANKRFAVGNGSAEKDVMIDAWKRLDKNIKDIDSIKIDDLADAYFLSNYANCVD